MTRPLLLATALLFGCLCVLSTTSAQDKIALDKPTPAWTIPWDADWVTAVTFIGDTRRLAAGNKRGEILVFDIPESPSAPASLPKGEGSKSAFPPPQLRLDGHTNTITALAATPDGRWLISASYDRTIRIWNLKASAKSKGSAILKGEKTKKGKTAEKSEFPVEIHGPHSILTGHKEWIRCMSLSQDGKQLLSGDDAGVSILWDMPAGKEVRRWQVKGWVTAVALSPDARHAITCEYGAPYTEISNGIHLWDATSAKELLDLGKSFKRGTGKNTVLPMWSAAFSRDGAKVALGQANSEGGYAKVFLVNASDGKKLHEMNGHQDGVTAVAFHPDGLHLASTGRDTTVRLWRIADGKHVADIGKGRGGQFKDSLHAISFTQDGRWLAAGDMAGLIQIWTFGKK